MHHSLTAYRVLNSLERFAAGVNITKENKFILQSFGMILVDIIPNVFKGQTFSVFNASQMETSNSMIDWGIRVTNESTTNVTNDSFATLVHVPKDSLSECNLAEATQQRLAYFAFFTDSLFDQQIASMITAVRVNCNVSELSTPISVKLHHNQVNVYSQL